MSRDWQKDMDYIQETIEERKGINQYTNTIYEIAQYWLQYAEKWRVPYETASRLSDLNKERADKLTSEMESIKERAEIALDGDRKDNYGLAIALTAIRQKAHKCIYLLDKEEQV